MRLYSTLFGLLLLSFLAYSSVVIINSHDPRAISSGVFYAYAKGYTPILYTPTVSFEELKVMINGDDVLLYTSTSDPVFAGLKARLENEDLSVEETTFQDYWDLNRKLLKDCKADANGFILTDPKFGQNIVPLFPYAKSNGYYVIYIDEDHPLPEGVSDKVKLIYGSLSYAPEDLSVPEIIGENRYLNSYKLADKYLTSDLPEVVFTDGQFLEVTLIESNKPILLVAPILSTNLENYVLGWVKDGRLKVGTLVGSQYAPTLKKLKDLVESKTDQELHIFIKIAKGVQGQMRQLDTIKFSGLKLSIDITSVSYNSNTKTLEVIYSNTGDVPLYVQGQYDVYVDDELVGSVGDKSPVRVPEGQTSGQQYPLDLSKYSGDIKVNASVMYGEAEDLLETGFFKSFKVGRNEFQDSSNLEIPSALYFPDDNLLKVKVSNPSEVKTYFKLSFQYSCDGDTYDYSDDRLYDISAGSVRVIPFNQFADCEDPSSITYHLSYGAREGFLLKTLDGEVSTSQENKGFDFGILLVIAVILVAGAIIYLKFNSNKGKRFGRW